jgi:twist-like factor
MSQWADRPSQDKLFAVVFEMLQVLLLVYKQGAVLVFLYHHRDLAHHLHTIQHQMTTFADINNFDWNSLSEQRLKQEPTIEWFDKLISTDPIESTTTTTATSPLEFSSLFDLQDRDTESLFSSNATSLDNTPLIKAEDLQQPVPELDLMDNQISRNNSSVSMTSTTSTNSTEELEKKPKKKRAPRKRLTAHQKQAHNKIEKRYRININAKIAGLQQIIPWLCSEKTAFETGDGCKPDEGADVPRLNKSMILEKATSYILYLQENEKKMKEQMEKMQGEIARLGGNVAL